jgi:hypothetical protein
MEYELHPDAVQCVSQDGRNTLDDVDDSQEFALRELVEIIGADASRCANASVGFTVPSTTPMKIRK